MHANLFASARASTGKAPGTHALHVFMHNAKLEGWQMFAMTSSRAFDFLTDTHIRRFQVQVPTVGLIPVFFRIDAIRRDA